MHRSLVALLALLLAASPVDAGTLLLLGAGVATPAAPSAYTGPGDVVSGASAWYSCSRGYSTAYSTGSNNGCNLRRASDNTTQDIVILSNGNFDVVSANTFAGTDATCQGSTTGLSVTIAFTSCSATPKAADTVTGSGISQPEYLTACGSFVGGAGSCTLTTAQNIGVAETVTMQVALYVTEAYDQSGNTNHMLQATAANQPQWLPNCVNSVPCMSTSPGGTVQLAAASFATGTQPMTFSGVAERFGNTTTENDLYFAFSGGGNATSIFYLGVNTFKEFAGSSSAGVTASDNAWHSLQGTFNGTSSQLSIDGTATTVNPSTGGSQTPSVLFNKANNQSLYMPEAGIWNSLAFSGTQLTNMCHNEFTYYATATSC